MTDHVDITSDGVIAWRLERAEKALEKKAEKEYVDNIAKEIQSLRKVVIGFMATVAGSAALVSFTLLVTVGSHGLH